MLPKNPRKKPARKPEPHENDFLDDELFDYDDFSLDADDEELFSNTAPRPARRAPKKKKAPARPRAQRRSYPVDEDDVEDMEAIEDASKARGSQRTNPDGTITDKKTGVTYRPLPGSDPEAMKAFKSSKGKGLSMEEMFRYTEIEEDFSATNLTASAKMFLPHTKVPISKEEREAAIAELKKDAQNNKDTTSADFTIRDTGEHPEQELKNPHRKQRRPRRK